jgi:hypothetical protein
MSPPRAKNTLWSVGEIMRAVLVGLALTVLAGCTAQNTSLNRLQFSGDVTAFPEHYQAEAARAVINRGGDLKTAQVSYPQKTLGESVFSPQRWYSCVRGLPAPTRRPDRLPNIEEAIGGWFGPPARVFDTILFFSSSDRMPSVRSGFDSPLCRDAEFWPITAAQPA